jgi:hypothetical protein
MDRYRHRDDRGDMGDGVSDMYSRYPRRGRDAEDERFGRYSHRHEDIHGRDYDDDEPVRKRSWSRHSDEDEHGEVVKKSFIRSSDSEGAKEEVVKKSFIRSEDVKKPEVDVAGQGSSVAEEQGRKAINARKSDDSWRQTSEVGNVESLWGFDEMEEASEAMSQMVYKAFRESPKPMSAEEREQVFCKRDDAESEFTVEEFKQIREQRKAERRKSTLETGKSEMSVNDVQIEERESSQVEKVVQQKTEVPKTEQGKVVYVKNDYTSVRDFVKKHKGCSIEDAYATFSKKVVDRELAMGTIYKSKNKLFI